MLHTLTLIQRNAEDPREVARLARAQERDLRAWLYEPEGTGTDEATLGRRAGREARRRGRGHARRPDRGRRASATARSTNGSRAQLQAAREAMVNAAKYAGDGATPSQVYAEVERTTVFVFVRDRGPGFDLDAVPDDRMGVRESIIGRMERHGGTAAVARRARRAARRSSWR